MAEKRKVGSETGRKWDVFISHASEDKQAVADPLVKALEAAGLSVWYDRIVLKLGDSLRQRIDHGLANSRYGVVILSPSFFAKHWPQQELNGLAQREVNGEKVILPVWHNITRDQVVAESPVLADRMAARWSDGPDSVVAAILDVVQGDNAQERSSRAALTRDQEAADYSSLVLVISEEGKNLFVRSEKIETADTVRLVLVPANARENAFLAEFRDQWRCRKVHVAYDLTAFSGQVESASHIRSGGKDAWTLEVKPDELDVPMEMGYNSMSADDIAKLRARRILVDEKSPKKKGRRGDMEDMMFDVLLCGTNGPLKTQQSPFPALHRDLGKPPELFIAAARLVAVLWLRLSGIVEHIFDMDLRLQGRVLAVHFEGQRHRQYANQDPVIIRVEGTCNLE